MVRIFMMQAMAIHPGDRINVEPEDVVHDRDAFDEPFLVVERAMRDPHVKNIGQIQPRQEPADDKVKRRRSTVRVQGPK